MRKYLSKVQPSYRLILVKLTVLEATLLTSKKRYASANL